MRVPSEPMKSWRMSYLVKARVRVRVRLRVRVRARARVRVRVGVGGSGRGPGRPYPVLSLRSGERSSSSVPSASTASRPSTEPRREP